MARPDSSRLEGIKYRELIEFGTIYISEYVKFHFYETCCYWDSTSGADKGDNIGIIYGIEKDAWKSMCFTVITDQSTNPLAIFQ